MSFLYRVVLECDACGDEFELQDSPEPLMNPPKLPKLPTGWKANVVDNAMQAEYGHACPRCIADIKANK